MTPDDRITIDGLPYTWQFGESLDVSRFDMLVEELFERPDSPVGLWGHPIRLGPRKVHVYGVDKNVWEQVMIEIDDDSVLAYLPYEEHFETYERLATFLIKFLGHGMTVYWGDMNLGETVDAV